MKKIYSVLTICVITFLVWGLYRYYTSSQTDNPTYYSAELVIRSANNIPDHDAVLNLVSTAKSNNIQILVIAAKQDEDDEFKSGTVFYNNTIAPQAFSGFDPLKDVITEAHKVGIKVKAWIPQFHNQVAFNNNPDWRMKAWMDGQAVDYKGTYADNPEFFVNPLHPDVQQYEISIIKEVVQNYEIDGIALDWIRFDEWNMDLSQKTRDDFKVVYGYDPTSIDFDDNSTQRGQWQEWRTTLLADYVGMVHSAINAIKPTHSLGIYILPPEFEECGQVASKFKDYLDFISPMCYWTDWKKTTDWVYNGVMSDTRTQVGTTVEMIPAIDISSTDDQYKDINAGIRGKHHDVTVISYFGYGQWTDADIKLIDTIRRY